MKGRSVMFVLIGTAFLFTLGCTGAAIPSIAPRGGDPALPSDKSRAERPTYKIGDTWMRSDGLYTLTGMDGDMYLFTNLRGGKVWLTRNLFVARVEKPWGYMEIYPPPKIRWPLKVGEWGTSNPLWHHSWQPAATPVDWSWKVETYTDEYVPFHGKVKVFKIVHTMTEGNYKAFQRTFVVWYAPELKRVVRIEGHPWFGPFLF